jgi:hypothetical protein
MIWQVRLLAWLHIVVGGLGLMLGVVLCASLALSSTHESTEAFAYIGGFFGFLAVPILVPALAGGIGLLRREPGGRILILILSALYLLLFPLGTTLGIFSFWTLLSPEGRRCFGRGETAGDQPSRFTIPWQRRLTTPSNPAKGVLLAMLVVAAGFVLVLAIGFRLSGQAARGAIDAGMPAAAIIFILAIIAGGVALARRHPQPDQRERGGSPPIPAWRQHRDKRIAELSMDPIKQKYIPLVEGGEAWSDDQIAYNEAPDMTVTCPHLQPIERDLRRTKIKMRRASSISVGAKCRIDEAAVRQHYNLAPPAYYVEDYQGDRSAQDYPVAYFHCRDCHSSISVLHPDQVRADTLTFPSAG